MLGFAHTHSSRYHKATVSETHYTCRLAYRACTFHVRIFPRSERPLPGAIGVLNPSIFLLEKNLERSVVGLGKVEAFDDQALWLSTYHRYRIWIDWLGASLGWRTLRTEREREKVEENFLPVRGGLQMSMQHEDWAFHLRYFFPSIGLLWLGERVAV